jgi:hypothetical protein
MKIYNIILIYILLYIISRIKKKQKQQPIGYTRRIIYNDF